MSELIQKNDNRATIRWKLLTGASALALTVYVSSPAKAEDGHPLIWLDLGGQMETIQSSGERFTAPFMSLTPEPDSYSNGIFASNQKPARYAFGFEAGIAFQPENSNWKLSAAIRYGRSFTKLHDHEQGPQHYGYNFYSSALLNRDYHVTPKALYAAAFADTADRNSERHFILDFSAGKDVGLGMLGHNGTSTVNAGVRLARFSSGSDLNASARPSVTAAYTKNGIDFIPWPQFKQFTLIGHVKRNFSGVGPAVSWTASAGIAGNAQDGELAVDWGINAAVLFGRQRTKVSHSTTEYALERVCTAYRGNGSCRKNGNVYSLIYHHPASAPAYNSSRSRDVTVPNVGGFIGLSMKYPDAKVSIGYRADLFMNAMDTGIDVAKKSNMLFHGPYASISIGLGIRRRNIFASQPPPGSFVTLRAVGAIPPPAFFSA